MLLEKFEVCYDNRMADKKPEEEFDEMDDLNLEINENAVFTCPNDDVITQDDVVFLCNTCESSDLIYKEGIYMCPSCLEPGENFECLKCGSKKVSMSLEE